MGRPKKQAPDPMPALSKIVVSPVLPPVEEAEEEVLELGTDDSGEDFILESDPRKELKDVGLAGLKYLAWTQEMLREHPIKEEMLDTQVKWSSRPWGSHKSIVKLLAIHKPGENCFPQGGYTIKTREKDFPRQCFPDQLISIPVKKKRKRKNDKSARPGKLEKPSGTNNSERPVPSSPEAGAKPRRGRPPGVRKN
jgi:hypothetical protein